MGSEKDQLWAPDEARKDEALDPVRIAAGLRGTHKVDLNLDTSLGRTVYLVSVDKLEEAARMLRTFGGEPDRSLRAAQKPRLKPVIVWNDLLPSPGLRKQTAKMLADQQAHITDLDANGRHGAARWQVWCTYALWVWYIAARPISMVVKTLLGRAGGA
jgi:hypothetical protein